MNILKKLFKKDEKKDEELDFPSNKCSICGKKIDNYNYANFSGFYFGKDYMGTKDCVFHVKCLIKKLTK